MEQHEQEAEYGQEVNLRPNLQSKKTEDLVGEQYFRRGRRLKLQDYLKAGAQPTDWVEVDECEGWNHSDSGYDGHTRIRVYRERDMTEAEIAASKAFYEAYQRKNNDERWESYLSLLEDVENGTLGPPEEFENIKQRRAERRATQTDKWKATNTKKE